MIADAQADLAEELRRLHHASQPLLLVNAWDATSARIIQKLGFPAVATTSAGIANARGYADGERIGLAEMLDAVAQIVRSVQTPVTADLEAAYGKTIEDARDTARGAIEAGAVGLNIEDGSHRPGEGLVGIAMQVSRIAAMREVAQERGVRLVINARTDAFWHDLAQDRERRLQLTLERARRYIEAGADSIFIPGATDAATIAALVEGIRAPINILATPATPTVSELSALGVRRISLGSRPCSFAMASFRKAAIEVRDHGTYHFADECIPYAELNALFLDRD